VGTNIEDLDREPAAAPPIIDSYGGRSLHEQSHGESFLAVVQRRFGPNGFYLLDEPESALSPSRQLALLQLIHDLGERGSQFIIATHSPLLMTLPAAQILLLSERGITPIVYEETDHYELTKRFLNNPEAFLDKLLALERNRE
jgi:predicted ATPase